MIILNNLSNIVFHLVSCPWGQQTLIELCTAAFSLRAPTRLARSWLDWPDTSWGCQAVLSFATAAPFTPVLIAGPVAALRAKGRYLFYLTVRANWGVLWAEQISRKITKITRPISQLQTEHTHTHTQLAAACRRMWSGIKLCTCKTQREECTDHKKTGPASPSHPCQIVFPLMLPLLFTLIFLYFNPANFKTQFLMF